jgi:hypothetical protein
VLTAFARARLPLCPFQPGTSAAVAPRCSRPALGLEWVPCTPSMWQASYGFLYLEYGPTAWWWEVEELLRKLLLSSLVVLIDAGSPLQVILFWWIVSTCEELNCTTGRYWALRRVHPLLFLWAAHDRAVRFRACSVLRRGVVPAVFLWGCAMQVTLAVLVCGWAHVLHAVYKPWGTGTTMYLLQHGSLGLTSFVFLMGLLFKVRRVGAGSRRAVLRCAVPYLVGVPF